MLMMVYCNCHASNNKVTKIRDDDNQSIHKIKLQWFVGHVLCLNCILLFRMLVIFHDCLKRSL